MVNVVTYLKIIERDLPKALARTAADPIVKRETAYYEANIGNIKTSKDFVNNYRLFSYAMKAHGLSDMTYAKAFMQKVMDGSIYDPKSMANSLSDQRFRAFAGAFSFGDKGSATTAYDVATVQTTAKFVQQSLEDDAGAQNEGAKLALYFQRKAPTITSGLSVLADKALFQFVQTTFNLPNLSSSTAIDKDVALIEKSLKLADLKDPAKLQKLLSRFAVMYDLKNGDAFGANPAVTLISSVASKFSASSTGGFSQDLLRNANKHYRSY